jgi:hypothetical protein
MMKQRSYGWTFLLFCLLCSFAENGFAQPASPCVPGWNGQLLIDGESPTNWEVEHHNSSSGTIVSVVGFIGNAVELNWNIGVGDWVQARYTFSQPVDLSQKDIFGLSLRGSAGVKNRVSLMFADVNGVFYGMDCDGINTIARWMKNLPLPKKIFYHFFTIGPDSSRKEIDWSQINRFFVVVKRPSAGEGGGSGQLAIDHLQADRAADWPRQEHFVAVRPDTAAAAKAVRYILNRQKATGLLLSWKEEPEPRAYLYDQALALIILTREGIWSDDTPANTAAGKAKKLVNFLGSVQKTDGHWPRTWNPETGQELVDDEWVGDQAWWVMALMEYAKKSGDETASASAQKGADWLAEKIDPTGKVVPSTEGTVDAWWAMVAAERLADADKIQDYLLSKVWDADLKYWWRGRDNNDNPDAFVAMDCATWVGEFAKSPRVNQSGLARAALSFVRRTLVTTDDRGALCGFDGMGPVGVWCEGTAQFVSAGGEHAQEFLDMLLSLQRDDGGMPGSPDNWSSDCYGWLSSWTGLAPTAWLYFALTRPPFPSMCFDNGEWVITTGDAPAVPEAPMQISLNGVPRGNAKLIQFHNQTEAGNRFPQIAVIASSGFIRLKQGADPQPPIPFGASVVLGPAYWEINNGQSFLHYNPQIASVNVNTDSLQASGSGTLIIDLAGTLGDLSVAYRLRLSEPTDRLSTLIVESKYRAMDLIALSQPHVAEHQAFRLIQFSTMYIDEQTHDSDAASYINAIGDTIRVAFKNVSPGNFLFGAPQAMQPFTILSLLHTDDFGYQGNTPNLGISLLNSSSLGGKIPQGFITPAASPQDDNVGLWINDDTAPLQINAGDSASSSFRIIAADNHQNGVVTRIASQGASPTSVLLNQNHPNPFNPSTRIEYFLPKSGRVTIKVYDLTGREVAVLVDKPQAVGWHSVIFNSLGLANGVYFYRLQTAGFTKTKKLLLLK